MENNLQERISDKAIFPRITHREHTNEGYRAYIKTVEENLSRLSHKELEHEEWILRTQLANIDAGLDAMASVVASYGEEGLNDDERRWRSSAKKSHNYINHQLKLLLRRKGELEDQGAGQPRFNYEEVFMKQARAHLPADTFKDIYDATNEAVIRQLGIAA